MERILLHERATSTRHEITTYWTMEDLARATWTLDLYDELQAQQAADARQEARQRDAMRQMQQRFG